MSLISIIVCAMMCFGTMMYCKFMIRDLANLLLKIADSVDEHSKQIDELTQN